MRSVSKWRKVGESVLVECPGCRQQYRLDHEISDLGVVTPSLDCPNDACTFHDMVILVGWPKQSEQ